MKEDLHERVGKLKEKLRLLTSAFLYGEDDFPHGVANPKMRPCQSRY